MNFISTTCPECRFEVSCLGMGVCCKTGQLLDRVDELAMAIGTATPIHEMIASSEVGKTGLKGTTLVPTCRLVEAFREDLALHRTTFESVFARA